MHVETLMASDYRLPCSAFATIVRPAVTADALRCLRWDEDHGSRRESALSSRRRRSTALRDHGDALTNATRDLGWRDLSTGRGGLSHTRRHGDRFCKSRSMELIGAHRVLIALTRIRFLSASHAHCY